MIKIGGLQKNTLIDYPGKIACSVFLIGCNFRCPFCYSPEIVLPEKIKNQPIISQEDFFSFLKERRRFLEGVVILGGEPTIHPDLDKFLRRIRRLGYLIKLDTNGSNPKMIKSLLRKKLIDYVALDIKAPKEKYQKTIGCQDKQLAEKMVNEVEKTLKILKAAKIDFECRTTIVPTLLDERDVLKIARWISSYCKKYFLQNFINEKTTLNPDFQRLKPHTKEFLLKILKKIAPLFEICQVR